MIAAPARETWLDANQHYLTAALAQVRAVLEAHAAGAASPASAVAAQAALTAVAARLPSPAALDVVCAAFGLSPFERDILLLCAGMELDSRFADACAAAQGDSRRAYATFGLALAALPEAHWSALAPGAPLRAWHLLEVGAGDTLATSPLHIDERVLHYLAGVEGPDERLRGLLLPVAPPDMLAAGEHALARRIVALWQEGPAAVQAVQLAGLPTAARGVAAAAAALLGRQLYALRATDVPTGAVDRDLLARLWAREALLGDGLLLIDAADGEGPGGDAAVRAFLATLRTPVLLAAREPLRTDPVPLVVLDLPRSNAAEQAALWTGVLGPLAGRLNGHVEALAGQFSLSLPQIRVAHAAVAGDAAAPGDEIGARLWEACRAQARPRLDDLAVRIPPAATWDDLVLPAPQRAILQAILAHVRHRRQVYDAWGFRARSARGLGISALFAGASGTGKTLAAEVLAGALRLDLYRIDLSQVVSKYIGETEKNLRRVFDAAESGGAILLFDEADALFGKRSEVKDSHDRYANIEVSYLLQRMEAYEGLAILTTNQKTALDTAFLRRIRFVVQFPFPDTAERAAIWRRIFPPGTPTAGLDPAKLARLNIAGGNIRNIALGAAFLAAAAGGPVTTAHVLEAARAEYLKIEKPLTEAEIGGWL